MGKECGAWVSRRLWGGGNTSPLKTTAWEANSFRAVGIYYRTCNFSLQYSFIYLVSLYDMNNPQVLVVVKGSFLQWASC